MVGWCYELCIDEGRGLLMSGILGEYCPIDYGEKEGMGSKMGGGGGGGYKVGERGLGVSRWSCSEVLRNGARCAPSR